MPSAFGWTFSSAAASRDSSLLWLMLGLQPRPKVIEPRNSVSLRGGKQAAAIGRVQIRERFRRVGEVCPRLAQDPEACGAWRRGREEPHRRPQGRRSADLKAWHPDAEAAGTAAKSCLPAGFRERATGYSHAQARCRPRLPAFVPPTGGTCGSVAKCPSARRPPAGRWQRRAREGGSRDASWSN